MSIVKIAKKAGVGVGTVSRYINDRSKVSDSSAARIAEAIEEIGYRPRLRRPGPKTRERVGVKTGVVLFLTIGSIDPERMLNMPAYPLLLTGIQKALMNQGISLMFANSSEEHEIPDMLDEKYCDGVIIQSFSSKALSSQLRMRLKSMPAVWCMREHCDYNNEFDHVFYNNSIVGSLAARFMHDNDHKKVAYFSSSYSHEAFRQRQDGFKKSCEMYGIEVFEYVSTLDPDELIAMHSLDLADQFLNDNKSVDGIFFCSDDTLLGVYNELRTRGVVFSEIDLLGCNNEEQFLSHIHPRPATIDIRLTEMGKQTVARLMSHINGNENGPAMELLVNPQLVPAD